MCYLLLLDMNFAKNIHKRVVNSAGRCKLRPVLFNIRINSTLSPPEYVELQRCTGFDTGYAANYRCAAISRESVTIRKISSPQNKVMLNHTRCAMKCACEGSFHFITRCPPPRVQDQDLFCHQGTRWNSKTCSCETVTLQQRPRSEHEGHEGHEEAGESVVSLKLFVFCLIGELVVVATLMYCFHSSRPKDPDDEEAEEDNEISIPDDYPTNRRESTPLDKFPDFRRTNNDSPATAFRKISVRHTYSC